MNVVDESLLTQLGQHLRDAAADPSIVGVVLASGKPGSFGAGADVAWLPELAARADLEAYIDGIHGLMKSMVRSSTPIVAAVNGTALGGALELALGAHALLCTPEAMLGLPEVTLGLIPGGGGTQLLRRFLTTSATLELLTSGTSVTGSTALELGLVRSVVPHDALVGEAVALARELAAAGASPGAPDVPAGSAEEAAEAIARVGASFDADSPQGRVVAAVRAGVEHGVDAGFEEERTQFVQALRSPLAAARVHLFLAERDARRGGGRTLEAPRSIGLVGGGLMGSGIAATAVSRGLSAVVKDVDDARLAASRAYLDKVLARTGGDADAARARWSGTVAWNGFEAADAVVEAVFELPELKASMLSEVSALVGPETLIATNTSAIPIATLANAVQNPERFLGMHFFSPVERMPLVELVPHAGTSPETLARARALGRALGKATIVAADSPGFFTSRVYARWLIESVLLLLDGAAVDVVDAGARAVGFPVGPLQAQDEVTIDLVVKASLTQVAEPVMSARLDIARIRATLESLIADGVLGRRAGSGYYTYEDGRRAGPNPAVGKVVGASVDGGPSAADAGERLLLAFVNESLLCWDDGLLCHPDDGDVAAVLGIGFPRDLGGPFWWTDATGPAEVLAGFQRHGAAFPTGPTLAALARDGGRFAGLDRQPFPPFKGSTGTSTGTATETSSGSATGTSTGSQAP